MGYSKNLGLGSVTLISIHFTSYIMLMSTVNTTQLWPEPRATANVNGL